MHLITLFYLTSVKSDSSVNRTFSSSTFYARVTFPGVQLSLFWWQKYNTHDSNWGQHMQKGLLKWTKPSTLSCNYDFWNKYLLLNVYTSTLCCFFAVASDEQGWMLPGSYWYQCCYFCLLIPFFVNSLIDSLLNSLCGKIETNTGQTTQHTHGSSIQYGIG